MSKPVPIESVEVFKRSDGVKVAYVTYCSGFSRYFYSSYSSAWPQSVHDFVDTHIPRHPISPYVTVYSVEGGLIPYYAQ